MKREFANSGWLGYSPNCTKMGLAYIFSTMSFQPGHLGPRRGESGGDVLDRPAEGEPTFEAPLEVGEDYSTRLKTPSSQSAEGERR